MSTEKRRTHKTDVATKAHYGVKYGLEWAKSHKFFTGLLVVIYMIVILLLQSFSFANNITSINTTSLSKQVSVSAVLSSDLSDQSTKKLINDFKKDKKVVKVEYIDKENAKQSLSNKNKNIYSIVSKDKVSAIAVLYTKDQNDLSSLRDELKKNTKVLYVSSTDTQEIIFKTIKNINSIAQTASIISIIILSLTVFIVITISNTTMSESIENMQLNGADRYFTYSPLFFMNYAALLLSTLLASFIMIFGIRRILVPVFDSIQAKIGGVSIMFTGIISSLITSFIIMTITMIISIIYFEHKQSMNRLKAK